MKKRDKYRVNWQKAMFVFDELERKGIDYDQISERLARHISNQFQKGYLCGGLLMFQE